MPEVIFNGSDGRLEGRYVHGEGPTAPLALVLHPHPQHGGTMNNRTVYSMFHMFVKRGFSVLRFNFRGVGRSQGVFDHGQGELRDAAAALDWMQQHNPNSTGCWVAGFSFGAWIAMQSGALWIWGGVAKSVTTPFPEAPLVLGPVSVSWLRLFAAAVTRPVCRPVRRTRARVVVTSSFLPSALGMRAPPVAFTL